MMKKASMYAAILERIFESKYETGMREVDFERQDIVRCAGELGVSLPKNLGDVVYSFRYCTWLDGARDSCFVSRSSRPSAWFAASFRRGLCNALA